MTVLECKKVKFYSDIDELFFFEWIKRISCVKSIEGSGSSVFLNLKSKEVSRNELVELIALFYRYEINMKQLSVFSTKKNNSWFKVRDKYWYKKIF